MPADCGWWPMAETRQCPPPPAAMVRQLIGPNKILGVSAKTPEEIQAAFEAGADYVGCGAVYPTATKDNSVHLGLEKLTKVGVARLHICKRGARRLERAAEACKRSAFDPLIYAANLTLIRIIPSWDVIAHSPAAHAAVSLGYPAGPIPISAAHAADSLGCPAGPVAMSHPLLVMRAENSASTPAPGAGQPEELSSARRGSRGTSMSAGSPLASSSLCSCVPRLPSPWWPSAASSLGTGRSSLA